MIRSIGSAYRGAFADIPRPVWVLSAVTLVNRSGTMVLPFLTLYLTSQRHQTVTQAGIAMSLYGVGAMAGSYLGGWLCDLVGPLRLQAASLALTGVAFLVLGSLRSPATILLTLLALSFVAEAFRPANASSLSEFSKPTNRARAFALNRLAINLGMTLGPALGGFLALKSYAWLFIVDAATCFAAAAVLLLYFRKSHSVRRHPTEVTVRPARSPWRDRPFRVMMAFNTILAVIFFQTMVTLPVALRDAHNLREHQIGMLLAINTVLIVLFEMVLTHLLAERNPLRIIGIGAFLTGAGMALLPLATGLGFVAFTVVVWSLGEMLSMPFTGAFVANRAEPATRGRYLGMFSLSYSLAFVIAPLVGTWVYEHLGSKALWYGCGGIGVLLWIGFHRLSIAIDPEHPSQPTLDTTPDP